MAVLIHPWSRDEVWAEAFADALPEMEIYVWPDVPDVEAVEYACIGLHDAADFARYPNLKAILAMSAGIEQFRKVDPAIPVVRLADEVMSNEMAAYALHWVAHFQKRFDLYLEHQRESRWEDVDYTPASEFRVGILGFGTIGRVVAETFRRLDYQVNAWSRNKKDANGVTTYAGADQLDTFLGASDAVVNILPNTPETRGLMNAARFRAMPPDSIYVTMGRGATTDADGLVEVLDAEHLRAAVLDVTRPEPLPADSPLWNHQRIRITPHVAGYTQVASATALIVANIRRIQAGETPFPLLDRSLGY